MIHPLPVPALDPGAVFPELEKAIARGDWVWLQPSGARPGREALGEWDLPSGGGVVIASGGSQGGRSFCLQPWGHLDRSAEACAHWLEGVGLSPERLLVLNPLPPDHVSGLMPWWRSRAWGSMHQRLDAALMKSPKELWAFSQALPGWGKTQAVVSLVPTQLKRLMEHPDGVAWLQQLALVWVGGAALPVPLANRARTLGVRLAPCYGATETVAMVAAQTPDQFLRGAVGCGAPLVDVELRVDRDGALLVRTNRLAVARWRGGQWTELADAEGWWRTGDAAVLSKPSKGQLQLEICGRLDGAIHSGGHTVFPEQLGQRLLLEAQEQDMPIEAILLLPVESPEWGERLVALIRLCKATASAAEWPSLESRLRAITAKWMPAERPVAWYPCDQLELSATGKWQRARWQNWLLSQESAQMP